MAGTLWALLKTGRVGMTVYTPDCTSSNCSSHLDHYIAGRTGLVPTYRSEFSHTRESAAAFYSNHPHLADTTKSLITDVLVSGPSRVTLWRGRDASQRLSEIKGSSHPRRAHSGTIRSSFWIDNSICNLVHSSDDSEHVAYELATIGHSHALDSSPNDPASLVATASAKASQVTHCAMLTLSRHAVYTAGIGARLPSLELPRDGSSIATMIACTNYLRLCIRKAKGDAKHMLSEAIRHYFRGDATYAIRLSTHTSTFRDWDRLVIRCGADSIDQWDLTSIAPFD